MDGMKIGDPGQSYTVLIIETDELTRDILSATIDQDPAARPVAPKTQQNFELLLENLAEGDVRVLLLTDKFWDRKVGDGSAEVLTTWEFWMSRLCRLMSEGGLIIYIGYDDTAHAQIQDCVLKSGRQYRRFPKPFDLRNLHEIIEAHRSR